MKDFKVTLGAYASGVVVWTILICTSALMIANIATMYNMNKTIDTMWTEISYIKETNGQLYDIIREHEYECSN